MPGLSIPPDFPLEDLVGQEVTQICLGIGQVQIHFYRPVFGQARPWEPGARFDLEAGFQLAKNGQLQVESVQRSFKTEAGRLSELLGDCIQEVQRLPMNELQVRFASGLTLVLTTDREGFESYHLHVSGESATVTKPSEA